jgi:hypothetical protein
MSLAIGIRRSGAPADAPLEWIASDRGLRQFRIVRDGCVRVATPVPAGISARDVRALRVMAFERPPAEGAPPRPPAGPVRLTRVNKVFMLDERFAPGTSLLDWLGEASIAPGGAPFELRIP